MKTLRLCAFVVLLAGCGTPKVWYQPGVSREQTERDLATARLAVNLYRPSGHQLYLPGQGASGVFLYQSIEQDNQRKSLIHDWMLSRGYQFVPTKTATNYGSTVTPAPRRLGND